MDFKKYIKKIVLKGYKSIKEINIDLEPINIIIGPNGAGKSNFISIFSMLRAMSQGKFQNYITENGGANTFLHFGLKKTSKMSVQVDIANNNYCAEFGYDSFDSFFFEKETLQDKAVKGAKKESGLKGTDNVTTYLSKCWVYHFHDTSKTAGLKQSSRVDSSDFLYSDAKNIASFLYRLKNDHKDDYWQIVRAVRAVAPFFHDFYLEPRGDIGDQSILLKWTHEKSDEPCSAQQLSDGTARFICLVTLFLQPKYLRPPVFVLDEPELGLHPLALEVLADVIKSVARHNQIICATQSVAFANQFSPNDLIVVDQHNGASTFSRSCRTGVNSSSLNTCPN
jgi:predicted ATPase